jgi:hypothetical protein
MTMIFRLRRAACPTFLLAASLVAPGESRAQLADRARIAVRTRVLVRMRDGTEGEWRFERASPDSLTLRRRVGDADELLSVRWSDAERVDTMVVAPPSARRILLGSAVGGLVGLAAAYAGAALAPCDWDGGDCPAFGFIVFAPAIIGTGIITGGAVGYRRRDWHWSTAWRAALSPAAPDH